MDKTFYDYFPADPLAIMSEGSSKQHDFIIVGGAPTPGRNNSRGNRVYGKASLSYIRNQWFKHTQSKKEPNIYWTFLSKSEVKFKKKIGVTIIRKYLPDLIYELRYALRGHIQSQKFSRLDLCSCSVCYQTNPIIHHEVNTCTVCNSILDIKSYQSETPKKRILVQGTDAAKQLCPGFTNMREDHGSLFYNPEIDALCIPTFEFWQMGLDKTKTKSIDRDLERFFTLPDPVEPEYQVVDKFETFGTMETVILDIETTGLNPFVDEIISIGYKTSHDRGVSVVEKPSKEMLRTFLTNLNTSNVRVVCHNAQFDTNFMHHKAGRDIPIEYPLIDTMLMAFVDGEKPLGLKHLTSFYTDRPGPRSFGSFEDNAYLAEDVLSTQELYNHFRKMLNVPAVELLHKVLPFMIEMRMAGVYIDQDKLTTLMPEFQSSIDGAVKVLENLYSGEKDVSEINWNSSPQIVEFLQGQGVPLTEKTSGGNYSASEPILQSLTKYDAVNAILDYRFHQKQLSFLENYKDHSQFDGKLHPRMMLHGTDTGRLSCRDPNLQQVPRVGQIKELFVSRWDNGYIGLIDLAQAELRIVALLSGDEKFAEALLAEDVHRMIASMILGIAEDQVTSLQRKASKAITFGLLYGGSDRGLAHRAGLSVSQVSQVRREFLNTFPVLAQFLNDLKSSALATGFVSSPFGRRRNIGDIALIEGDFSAERKATNTPIQGTASDVMLSIMSDTHENCRFEGLHSRPIFGVHDSTLIDIHQDEISRVSDIVQTAFFNLNNTPLSEFDLWSKLPLPGELIIGKSWAAVESTSDFYDPDNNRVFQCSSLAKTPITNRNVVAKSY